MSLGWLKQERGKRSMTSLAKLGDIQCGLPGSTEAG